MPLPKLSINVGPALAVSLPVDLAWGVSLASYQIESASADGREPSVRDAHCRVRDHNGDTGDVACDHYHHCREEVALMRKLGMLAHGFSVACQQMLLGGGFVWLIHVEPMRAAP